MIQNNSFEQLCINYANERLQQLYISDIFKETERIIEKEGLKEHFNKVNFLDNTNIIEVIDKPPTGVFLLLDTESSMKADDKGFNSAVGNVCKADNPVGTVGVIKRPRTNPDKFIINHTAREVEYNSIGFCQRHLDDFKL